MMVTHSRINLPNDLLEETKLFKTHALATSLLIEVPTINLELSADDASPEVILIQRLISLAKKVSTIQVNWNKKVADVVFKSPNLFPLFSVAICLDNAEHAVVMDNGSIVPVNVQETRQLIYKYRLVTDLFSDKQVLICADSRGHGRPKSLYSSKTSGLIARTDFESLVDRLLAGQAAVNASLSETVKFSQNISTIVAELFENTDIHGRKGLDGVPIKKNGIRGIIFNRIKVCLKDNRKTGYSALDFGKKSSTEDDKQEFDAFEISVFDSGVGFYSSFSRQERTDDIPLQQEWDIMRKCLERHHDDAIPDVRSSHQGMGLYEVLRVLNRLKGRLEVRSGRTHGYRTFEPGEYKLQHESSEFAKRPGMPKAVLLDVKRRFVTVPSINEALVGASIRVIVPLN